MSSVNLARYTIPMHEGFAKWTTRHVVVDWEKHAGNGTASGFVVKDYRAEGNLALDVQRVGPVYGDNAAGRDMALHQAFVRAKARFAEANANFANQQQPSLLP